MYCLLQIQFTSSTQIKPSQSLADGFWTRYKYCPLTYLCSKLSGSGECLDHEVELQSCKFSRSGETFQCICSGLLDDVLRLT